MSVIIHGPQACGKSRNAKALAAHFNCSRIIDDWNERLPLLPDTLMLTNEAPIEVKDVLVLDFGMACRLAAITVS
ncbi:MAG: hypothetical protein WC100_00825 [Sterolibacterium sp.]